MLFEITTLAGSVFTAKKVKAGAHKWLHDAAAGSVLGMWTTEIGPIGDLVVLRGFEDAQTLASERRRALHSDDPFGSASAGARLTMESYAPFPFLPDPSSRDYGGTFELRTYHLVPGGLPATLAGWKEAVGPVHRYTDHLVTALYALDGDLRITHLWGFASLEERNALRREHYASGLWPPKGAPSTSRARPQRSRWPSRAFLSAEDRCRIIRSGRPAAPSFARQRGGRRLAHSAAPSVYGSVSSASGSRLPEAMRRPIW